MPRMVAIAAPYSPAPIAGAVPSGPSESPATRNLSVVTAQATATKGSVRDSLPRASRMHRRRGASLIADLHEVAVQPKEPPVPALEEYGLTAVRTHDVVVVAGGAVGVWGGGSWQRPPA